MMKLAKIFGVLALVYVGLVVVFESAIGYFQPQGGDTLVLTVRDGDGARYDRVLSRIEVDDQVYVAVNHWPRSWFNKLREKPQVEVTFSGKTAAYRAVEVTASAEIERLNRARPLGIGTRILTGFPPRKFVRFDPVTGPVS